MGRTSCDELRRGGADGEGTAQRTEGFRGVGQREEITESSYRGTGLAKGPPEKTEEKQKSGSLRLVEK
jgi:hypothetical protein